MALILSAELTKTHSFRLLFGDNWDKKNTSWNLVKQLMIRC